MFSLNKGLLLSLVFSTGVLRIGFVEEVKIIAANNRNRFENDSPDTRCGDMLLNEHLKPKKCSVGRIIEKEINEHRRECLFDRKCEPYKTLKCFSLTEYIEKTKSVVLKVYNRPTGEYESRLHYVLQMIYKSFPERNMEKMAIFTAHALFNTSCFKELEEKEGDDFKCRGLLIKGKENYRKLDNLGFWAKSFVTTPKYLAEVEETPIKATVDFFLSIIRKDVCGNLYVHSLEVLKPMEYVRALENKETPEDCQKLKKKTSLYNLLVAEYNK